MTLDTLMTNSADTAPTGSANTGTTIQKSAYLATPPSRVWEFLTKPEFLAQWFHPAQQDLAEGEDFLLTSQKDGDRMCWGQVEVATPHSYMKWAFTVAPLQGEMTTVEWRLTETAGGTCLTLEHSGLPTDAAGYGLVMALDKGWHGFLSNLHNMG